MQSAEAFCRTKTVYYLRSNIFGRTDPTVKYEKILSGLGYATSPTISERTTMRWLHSLDISFREIQNPIYIDEHEREDVIAYHQTFLEQMRKCEERLPVVEGLDGSDENVRVSWPVEELRPMILVTHDESPFAFHDGLKRLWLPAGEQPLRKRGQGRSIHVSEFLSDVGGRLELDDEKKLQYPNLPAEACVLVHQGAQHDDWWKAEDLLKQVKERAIPISKAQSPGKQALFAFDNATRHCAVAPEANFLT